MNCHIMQSYFDDENRASHKAVATCNDCHTPEDFARQAEFKAALLAPAESKN